jgi:hypothetical protein
MGVIRTGEVITMLLGMITRGCPGTGLVVTEAMADMVIPIMAVTEAMVVTVAMADMAVTEGTAVVAVAATRLDIS